VDWQPEDRDAWVADAERWIAQIKSVLQCKIDLAPDGEVAGVHVVARSDREPRHIVRDVEGLLKARLGVSVFYKKIGVVQVVEAESTPMRDASPSAEGAWNGGAATGPPPPPVAPASPATEDPGSAEGAPSSEAEENTLTQAARDAILLAEELGPRLLCNGVGVMMTGDVLRAEVDLQAAGLEASGVAEGPNRTGGDLHLVAAATLDAVESLVGEPLGLELTELRRERLGSGEVILVAVEMVQGRRCEQLYGACQQGANQHQAVVYAVLDALNRRLEMMLFRSIADAEH
jgi:hypothetical protein